MKKTGGGVPNLKKFEDYEEILLSFVKKSEPITNIMDSSTSDLTNESSVAINEPIIGPSSAKKEKLALKCALNEVTSINVLKAIVLATQGLAEAQRLEDSDLKERIIVRLKSEVESGLNALEEDF